MTRKLLFTLITVLAFGFSEAQQVVSIVGTGVNGWPGDMTGIEIDLMTSDFVTYTLTNVTVNTGEVKFRYNHQWDTNWGGSTFPQGTGTQGGPNIPTVAGTYDITFNRNNGTYTFIGAQAFPAIGIWGPAVDSQNGFGGPDVKMASTDGVDYKLSAFWFSSGSAVFRQNDNSLMTYSSTSFPSGTAVASGPNMFIPGGQWTATFNRLTGEYDFTYPSVGIMGTFNNWDDPDINMTTTNGESYSLQNFTMAADGFIKLRLDDDWTMNWGGENAFPNGTLVFNGQDIPVSAGTYNVSFNRNTLGIVFTPVLGVNDTEAVKLTVYPNPTKNAWNFSAAKPIEQIKVYDLVGKLVATDASGLNEISINTSGLAAGVYVARITSGRGTQTVKLVKS